MPRMSPTTDLGATRRLAADARYGVLSDRVSHVSPLSPNHGAARARDCMVWSKSRRPIWPSPIGNYVPLAKAQAPHCQGAGRPREDIHEPSGFERIRLERVRGDSATSMIQLAHEGVLANRWALNNPISGAKRPLGGELKTQSPPKWWAVWWAMNECSFKCLILNQIWRRGWDSNPRYACTYA